MSQMVDLTNTGYPPFIDSGTVKFNLSAWIGGFSGQDDNARVSLTFYNQANQVLGSQTTIGPVLAADRNSISSLLFRQATDIVPIGARSFKVLVTITRVSGTYDDGCVDNIRMYFYQ